MAKWLIGSVDRSIYCSLDFRVIASVRGPVYRSQIFILSIDPR